MNDSTRITELLRRIGAAFRFVKLPERSEPIHVQITLVYPGCRVIREFDWEDGR